MAFINKLAKALGVVDDGNLGYYGEWMMSKEEAQARYDERLENDVIDKIEELVQSIKPKEKETQIVEYGVDCHEELKKYKVIAVRKYGMMQTFKIGEMIKLDFYQESQEKKVLVIDESDNYYYCKEV